MNLRTDSIGRSTPGALLIVPAGCTTAGPPGDQLVTSQAVKYIGSLFVPRRVAGRNLNFLVDTGCTHNLLNRMVFDRLPAQTHNRWFMEKPWRPWQTAAICTSTGALVYQDG